MHSSSRFRPAEGRHVQSSALCASCHTLTTHALGAGGAVIGSLSEQMPYAEWQRSVYAQPAGGAASAARSCQDCHMPAVAEPTPIASVLGEPRPDLSRHTFVGANAFMLRLLDRHRDALGVEAPSPALAEAARRAERLLTTSTATIAIGPVRFEGDTVIADVTVSNLAGHKLPTGYPSRRVWIEFTATDAAGRVVFSSGALSPDGRIAGNDADASPTGIEPHHDEIARGEDVQIYEATMVDAAGVATTGLLSGVRYAKDNRLLPRGFDPAGAPPEIAVHGEASADPTFTGGSDRVRYRVAGLGRGDRFAARLVPARGRAALPADRLALGPQPGRLRRAGDAAVRRVLRRRGGGVGHGPGPREPSPSTSIEVDRLVKPVVASAVPRDAVSRGECPMSVRTTRREVLKVGGAAAASMAVSSLLERVSAAGVLAPAWKNLPIGTQAWCVRKQLATDIPGTLAMVSKAGFELLELENAFGKSGAEWKAALDAAKLKPAGFHHTLAELFPDKLNATIEFNQALGNQNLIIRSLPPAVYNSVEMLKQTTDVINGVAEKLKPHKLRVGYHNHTTDFNRLDGEYWWNRFADLTGKDVVLQFDTGNASEKEGVDVVEVLKRNPGRVKSMHVKPFSKASPNAFIGADELNWPAIMTAAETVAGVELYIIEYEKDTGRPPIDDLKPNLEAFKKLRA